MEMKLLKLVLIILTQLSLKDFIKKYILKNDAMNEFEIQRVYNYLVYPRDSKIESDKGFTFIDNGSQGGTHWTCFIVKNNKNYYFDNFGGAADDFLFNPLPKPIVYHIYKIQDINPKLCGSYCLYFFYLLERINYYDTILKRYFG